jgi:hypothetical protein
MLSLFPPGKASLASLLASVLLFWPRSRGWKPFLLARRLHSPELLSPSLPSAGLALSPLDHPLSSAELTRLLLAQTLYTAGLMVLPLPAHPLSSTGLLSLSLRAHPLSSTGLQALPLPAHPLSSIGLGQLLLACELICPRHSLFSLSSGSTQQGYTILTKTINDFKGIVTPSE